MANHIEYYDEAVMVTSIAYCFIFAVFLVIVLKLNELKDYPE